MRRRRRPSVLALLPALALLAACQSGGGEASGPTRVTVAHVPSTLFAPLYLAQAKGYFKEQGLDVDLRKVQAGQDAVPLAGTGKVDAVVAGFSAGLFNAMDQGLKVKVAASMGASTGARPSPTALEVAQRVLDSGEVKDAADLKGRKVAVAGGAGAAGGYQLAATLRGAGLTLKDVTVVNVAIPDMRSALADGGVDAALAPAPFTTAMEEAGVARPLAVPPRGTSATGVVFGTAFADKPAAEKFLTALRKGAADLQGAGATSEETLGVLAEATGQKVEVLRKTPSYQWDPRLAPDAQQLAAQKRAYRDADLLR
ncbi:ABC transporter substrate-binding protein [Streptomyces morookaense]|uniref:ABC transporter substrate-binding protein n=1 Tax=Streptomyces morookaense TaxID=1970 RepID=UPI0019AC94B3|nr:ABC transporter substrate-binding protein [Streptomyces morookaense]GHF36177.1 nitrate ABC transporter substrate-binding protein [Streptomyces morookaense]